jgi:hypothetical protein
VANFTKKRDRTIPSRLYIWPEESRMERDGRRA